MSRPPGAPRTRNPLKRIRPSYLILLLLVPAVVYFFVTTESYQRALSFLAPGLYVTVVATVLAYIAACILGMILAALASLNIGERTVLRFAVAGAVLLVAAVVIFTRPKVEYALVGHTGGKVAIVQGTPSGPASSVKNGAFPGAEGVMPVRAAIDAGAAVKLLQDDTVQAAFVPAADAPPGSNVLWTTHFLAPKLMQPAMALLVFGVAVLLLTFGASQSGRHPLNIFAELYIDALRGIPMLVIILYVGFPLQGAIRDATGGLINMSRLTRGVVGIALGYAAYLAEIFRAGIEAIPHGQTEAARSLGLNGWQTARYVILPQALRIVVPPLGNEFIAMLKDTSLLSVLSVRDITQRAREFQAATFQVFPPFNTVALLYIGLTLAASSMVKWLERRTSWTR
ncbi:MAG TPA: amino acid ABC transporter permease [Trueperaceae bacterium]|nr:amino acid ABC transporter permease [Trueperaceae bacterium]